MPGSSNTTSYPHFYDVFLWPYDKTAGTSLKDAADTSAGKWRIPSLWGTVDIIEFGMWGTATGGAQTTAGTLELRVAGTAVNSDAAAYKPASVASHVIDTVAAVSLNSTSSSAVVGSSYDTAPAYPSATSAQLIEALVDTQGVGAGDQVYLPYIIVRRRQAAA